MIVSITKLLLYLLLSQTNFDVTLTKRIAVAVDATVGVIEISADSNPVLCNTDLLARAYAGPYGVLVGCWSLNRQEEAVIINWLFHKGLKSQIHLKELTLIRHEDVVI